LPRFGRGGQLRLRLASGISQGAYRMQPGRTHQHDWLLPRRLHQGVVPEARLISRAGSGVVEAVQALFDAFGVGEPVLFSHEPESVFPCGAGRHDVPELGVQLAEFLGVRRLSA
jgi:hypothetical protein